MLLKVECVMVGVIQVIERHLMLKFKIGPNRSALFPDIPLLYDPICSHVELFSPCLA